MTYPIGTIGQPWGAAEKAEWLNNQTLKRSYNDEVVAKINHLAKENEHILTVTQYGSLSQNPSRYPLYVFTTKNINTSKPTIVVTGGVHGYETSGVQGALLFIEKELENYHSEFNFVVFPCVSPWGYETINRWNPSAIDPNRSFYQNSPSEEAANVMAFCQSLEVTPLCHVDLHETTDTDNSEFRPALAARDAIEQKTWNIPDGFYCVGDTSNPQDAFQTAIIESVKKVTHIAPADDKGQLIGVDIEQEGVINYDKQTLGLCGGFTGAEYVTTTEVYPDSPLVDDDNCNQAQVATVTGALDFLLKR